MKNIVFIPTTFSEDSLFEMFPGGELPTLVFRDETTPWTEGWYYKHPASSVALALSFNHVTCDLTISRLQSILGMIENFVSVTDWHRSWSGFWELRGHWRNREGHRVPREVHYGERFSSRPISDSDDGACNAKVESIDDYVLALAYAAEARGLGKVEVFE